MEARDKEKEKAERKAALAAKREARAATRILLVGKRQLLAYGLRVLFAGVASAW